MIASSLFSFAVQNARAEFPAVRVSRLQREIIERWLLCVRSAIRLGEADASYKLTVGFVRRLREMGLWS